MAAVAAVAADKHKSTNVKGHEHLSTLFCYLLYDDLYSDVNMTLRGIDLKPEPIQEKKIEQSYCVA